MNYCQHSQTQLKKWIYIPITYITITPKPHITKADWLILQFKKILINCIINKPFMPQKMDTCPSLNYRGQLCNLNIAIRTVLHISHFPSPSKPAFSILLYALSSRTILAMFIFHLNGSQILGCNVVASNRVLWTFHIETTQSLSKK